MKTCAAFREYAEIELREFLSERGCPAELINDQVRQYFDNDKSRDSQNLPDLTQ